MAKVINAVFGGGLFATTAKVFQYDVGDKLRFLGVDLPAGYSVDFANSRTGASTTVLGDAGGVTIPPEFFIPGTEIYAWVVISDADGHYTKYQAKIPIYERAARSSVEPTPAQADALDDAINALNSAVEDVQDIADNLNDQIDTALAEAKASGEFDGPPGPKGDAYALTAADREEIAGIASDDVLVVSDEEPTGSPLPKIWIDSGDDSTVLIPTMDDIGDLSDLVTTAKNSIVAAINEAAQRGGGGGTGDYPALTNKPQINGVELSGNKTAADLDLAPAGAYVKPSGGIPKTDLAPEVQTSLGKADTALQSVPSTYRTAAAQDAIDDAQDAAIAVKYTKPSGGIPKTDLAAAVQTSLGKADTALQSVPSTYRTAAAQDTIDAEQDTMIAGKLSATGNAYRAASIPMGHLDSTSTATVMTAQVDGITELRDGVCVWLRNGVIASASGVTLNVNSLGAKPIYNSLSGAIVTTTFTAASTYLFVYNSTRVDGGCWDIVYGYDTNTTYTPPKLGFGYGTCTTAAATVAKTVSISNYTLVPGGIVAIKFNEDVPAGASLNINSKGAKVIFHKGAAITRGVIKAGDTVTMIYSTYYHVLSIDRGMDTLPPSPSNNAPVDISTVANAGSSTDYARADHMHRLDVVVFKSILDGVSAVNAPVILYDANNNGVVIRQSPQTLMNIYRHQPKLNFALIVPPDTQNYPVIFTASSLNATTGELHLTGITGGVLYEATLLPGLDPIDNDSIAMVGTMTTTNLALPSAQGVSF